LRVMQEAFLPTTRISNDTEGRLLHNELQTGSEVSSFFYETTKLAQMGFCLRSEEIIAPKKHGSEAQKCCEIRR